MNFGCFVNAGFRSGAFRDYSVAERAGAEAVISQD